MPVFSGGRNRAKTARAIIERETAELNLAKAKRNLHNQLQTAENNYNNAIANIETYKETILLNESEIEIFRKQLSLDVVTTIEFKESRLRLTQSRLELLNAYLDLHIAHLQIVRITGSNKLSDQPRKFKVSKNENNKALININYFELPVGGLLLAGNPTGTS